jgi:hypothetical protein
MPDKAGTTPRAWQRMLSGRRLNLLDPSPLDIEIADIAHGLARVARWNGQTAGDHAFSVAQHSLLVERIFCLRHPGAAPAERLATLLHDAPEYVIGDMISPFKRCSTGPTARSSAGCSPPCICASGCPPSCRMPRYRASSGRTG